MRADKMPLAGDIQAGRLAKLVPPPSVRR
jgi:hypothetical protein